MHVFIGGAYNGKTDYVMTLLEDQEAVLVDGYLPESIPECDVLVIKGLEKWLVTQNLEEDEALVNAMLTRLQALEENRTLYIIVTDMGRGVVPMEKQARLLRDTCGRLYQALFAEAERVIRIWYGIAEQIK
ncbi:bifunctional adenosylcobinamide kinase/adenosylcobinamide-phosphate guanylyltransferase [Lysinibacillus pakistanensis]|uniref:Bifunctional adenosylcobinamide kinase/adenosylcobinamide-phosphate guanylyltransferase n=1 Tax=Lysinibacillus pakistanensis TaxID=759811 RepID=A0AAX3X0Q1_9BACI|nr:bifunctional adenosylcobinamide kinase/adenosylcobinamide-phosphate guanylyltransferase [Lysinibacillus pakistanensis]MDM5233275.1 bifunctional adenosylcobinamide kinase/adenosylcobinamide-phosphate guanylyltransferase [Lysinibacillus pakistanensis]WHY48753.1 bifunctional adenosylcobinamide kinase/adenosylcobinamide-phosphate guanylyltransferase [Lysinibacillus pakistanensis]WHY53765.1 bifunctional adenosylcobinamide kinase/adenosylcobinamide-phosphate guanylyltransferase [Lysinibacillus paki